jgi:hypothetical protein
MPKRADEYTYAHAKEQAQTWLSKCCPLSFNMAKEDTFDRPWSSRIMPASRSSVSITFAPRSPALKRAANTICLDRIEKISNIGPRYHESDEQLAAPAH